MLLIRNGRVLDPASGTDTPRDVLLDGERIAAVAPHGQLASRAHGAEILDAKDLIVAPGFVDSPWNKDWPADRKVQSIERTPLKRACKPEDIAEVIFFLCAGAAMVTGQTVIVDGGLTL